MTQTQRDPKVLIETLDEIIEILEQDASWDGQTLDAIAGRLWAAGLAEADDQGFFRRAS